MTTLTIQDVFCFGSNKSSNKKIDKEGVLPFVILPILLLCATISLTITIIIMIVIGMGALYVQTRPRQKNRCVYSKCKQYKMLASARDFALVNILTDKLPF